MQNRVTTSCIQLSSYHCRSSSSQFLVITFFIFLFITFFISPQLFLWLFIISLSARLISLSSFLFSPFRLFKIHYTLPSVFCDLLFYFRSSSSTCLFMSLQYIAVVSFCSICLAFCLNFFSQLVLSGLQLHLTCRSLRLFTHSFYFSQSFVIRSRFFTFLVFSFSHFLFVSTPNNYITFQI